MAGQELRTRLEKSVPEENFFSTLLKLKISMVCVCFAKTQKLIEILNGRLLIYDFVVVGEQKAALNRI